jgi:hypothetical protein
MFNAITIKIPVTFLTEIKKKTNPKVHIEAQMIVTSQDKIDQKQQ